MLIFVSAWKLARWVPLLSTMTNPYPNVAYGHLQSHANSQQQFHYTDQDSDSQAKSKYIHQSMESLLSWKLPCAFLAIAFLVVCAIVCIGLGSASVRYLKDIRGDMSSITDVNSSNKCGLVPDAPPPLNPRASSRPDSRCTDVRVRSYDGTCSTTQLAYAVGSVANATLEIFEPAGVPVGVHDGPNERVLSNVFFKGPAEIENTHNVNLWFAFLGEIEDFYVHAPVEETHSGATQEQLVASGRIEALFDFSCLRLMATTPVSTIPGVGPLAEFFDPEDKFSLLLNPNLAGPYLTVCDAHHLDSTCAQKHRCFCTKSKHTPWIDLDDIVYPSDPAQVSASRTLIDGKLKTTTLSSGEEIPPTWAQTGRAFPFNGVALFSPSPNPLTAIDLAGTLGGASLNVITSTSLFYREHNRLAAQLQQANPTWTDEQLFQRARAWNIAQYQAIWVYEWLPVALGPLYSTLFGGKYTGNVATTDTAIPTAFDSAIRSIHSMLYEDLDVVHAGPTHVADLPALFAVANASGNIDALNSPLFGGSTAPIVRSWLVGPANQLDSIYIEDLRTLLVPGPHPIPALDLAATDIRRSRLDRASNYYHTRLHWRKDDLYQKSGCTSQTPDDPLACFLAITSNHTIATQLQKLYRKLTAIDLHVGAMVEDRQNGVVLPPTYAHVMAATLRKLRAADAFWFENTAARFRQFTNTEIATIRKTRLMDIINRNTPLTCPLPEGVNSFHVAADYAC